MSPLRPCCDVFGGGVKLFLTQGSGIRADVRVHVGNHTERTLLSADPDVVRSPSEFEEFGFPVTGTSPTIYFDNGAEAEPGGGFGPSSFSGPAISDFESYSADGIFRQVLVTVGYFWRF